MAKWVPAGFLCRRDRRLVEIEQFRRYDRPNPDSARYGHQLIIAPDLNANERMDCMDQWEKKLTCALACHRCDAELKPDMPRILSVYDHEPICMGCKKAEEGRDDYEAVSRETIGSCMAESEVLYGDPQGYCLHHFFPFTCK
jgi:hypothetical protein